MPVKVTREKALLWITYALVLIAVLIGAYAATLYLKIDEVEAALLEAKRVGDKAAAGVTKAGQEAKAAAAKAAEIEKRAAAMERAAALLAKAEPRVSAALEAAARSAKPDVRADLLAGAGLIGLLTSGAKSEAAMKTLERAIQADKSNCLATVALKQSGATIEVPEPCQAMMPASPAAAPAASAPAPKPAPAAAPSGGAEKTGGEAKK